MTAFLRLPVPVVLAGLTGAFRSVFRATTKPL